MELVECNQVMLEISRLRDAGRHEESIRLASMALEQYPDFAPFLFGAACTYMDIGYNGLAAVLLEKSKKLNPKDWRTLMNLASCYRRMYKIPESIKLAKQAIKRVKEDHPDWRTNSELDHTFGLLYSNISACYVNEGMPGKGEDYGRLAVRYEDSSLSRWNLSLLLLEQGKWEEGFRLYRDGKGTTKRAPRNYAEHGKKTPILTDLDDLKEGQTVVVHGEQGIGDEIMFGTCMHEFIRDAKERGANVIFECQNKLGELFQNAFLDIEVKPTRNDEDLTWPLDRRIDWTIPIGDLPAIYRLDDDAFVEANKRGDTAYLRAHEGDVSHIRSLVMGGNDKPVIGIAWTGGLIKTAVTYRSLTLRELHPILELDANFVSLQYNNPSKELDAYKQQYGPFAREIKHFGLLSGIESDSYQRMAELVMACDVVVTVCQSVAHLAGALGKQAVVLVPHKCAWRYCPHWTDFQVWYRNNRLVRQEKGDSWAIGVREARDIVEERLLLLGEEVTSEE